MLATFRKAGEKCEILSHFLRIITSTLPRLWGAGAWEGVWSVEQGRSVKSRGGTV